MMSTTPLMRLVAAVAGSMLLAGCGGGGDDSSSDSGSDSRAVDRSGYFTEEQSETLNPALGAYEAAFRKLDTTNDACVRTANRLFKAGRDSKVAVKCHLDNTGGVITALEKVDAAFESVEDADVREECTAQLDETRTFVADYRDAWKTVQGDWQAYADGKQVSEPLTQRHFNEAYEMNSEFVTTALPELSKACYTKADRDAADDDA